MIFFSTLYELGSEIVINFDAMESISLKGNISTFS